MCETDDCRPSRSAQGDGHNQPQAKVSKLELDDKCNSSETESDYSDDSESDSDNSTSSVQSTSQIEQALFSSDETTNE